MPVPDWILMQTLVSLDLSYNHFLDARRLAEELATLPSLRILHVEGNPLHLQQGYAKTLRDLLPFTIDLDVHSQQMSGVCAACSWSRTQLD